MLGGRLARHIPLLREVRDQCSQQEGIAAAQLVARMAEVIAGIARQPVAHKCVTVTPLSAMATQRPTRITPRESH